MPEIDIGLENFYGLDPSLNMSKPLEMPLDEMRVAYPLQENDEEAIINEQLIELCQPSTSNFEDLPSTNASLFKLDQPPISNSLESSSIEYLTNDTAQPGEQDILIENMPFIYTNENSASQTTEFPEEYELIIVPPNESTSNQNEIQLPQRKKPKNSINPEKKSKLNQNELELPRRKKSKKSINSEKNYKFSYPNCDKSYVRSDHLREHINTKHLNKGWRCRNCHDYLYTSKKGKENHIIKNPNHSVYEVQE